MYCDKRVFATIPRILLFPRPHVYRVCTVLAGAAVSAPHHSGELSGAKHSRGFIAEHSRGLSAEHSQGFSTEHSQGFSAEHSHSLSAEAMPMPSVPPSPHVLPTAEEDDFHRIWNSISKSSEIQPSHRSSLSLSSRSNAMPTSAADLVASPAPLSDLLGVSSPSLLPQYAADVSSSRLLTSSGYDDVSGDMLQHLLSFSDGSGALDMLEPFGITGVTEVTPSSQIAALSGAAAALRNEHALRNDFGGSMSMPPLLCATLSDLSFNLDGAWWGDVCGADGNSALAAAAAFLTPGEPEAGPPWSDEGGPPRSEEAVRAYAQCLHRLSSGFSDWRKLEPPRKKQQ